jgi:hypothetical protein
LPRVLAATRISGGSGRGRDVARRHDALGGRSHRIGEDEQVPPVLPGVVADGNRPFAQNGAVCRDNRRGQPIWVMSVPGDKKHHD